MSTTKSKDIPSWNKYYLDIATAVAARASCFRASVGCVIVKGKQIISTGYNGAPTGRQDCLSIGSCYRKEHNIESGTRSNMCRAAGAHAEVNAIANAAKHGVSVDNSTMFLVGHDFCCSGCQALVLNSGIKRVVLRRRDNSISVFNMPDDFIKHPILDL